MLFLKQYIKSGGTLIKSRIDFIILRYTFTVLRIFTQSMFKLRYFMINFDFHSSPKIPFHAYFKKLVYYLYLNYDLYSEY